MPLDLIEIQKKFDKFFEETTIEEFEKMVLENRKREAELTPPTTEEAELWKEKIQDIIRKNIKTCILDGGEMKTPEEKIGIMGEYNAATEILELLSRRSEQNTDLPIEEIKKNFAGYINWCGNGLKPDIAQLDNLFRYIRKSGCILTQNGFKWEAEQNSEAIEFAEWCVETLQPMFSSSEYLGGKGKFKFWIKNSGIHEKDISTAEAYQEFLLFKQKQ